MIARHIYIYVYVYASILIYTYTYIHIFHDISNLVWVHCCGWRLSELLAREPGDGHDSQHGGQAAHAEDDEKGGAWDEGGVPAKLS